MTDRPLVTVVTPSYNQREFVEAAIESVLSQDYPHIEYIIMDGGSTDGSVEIIKRYASRLAWWQTAPDGGQAAAVNRGWARATGSILAFLNSDDLYLPGAIRTIVEAFDRHPQAGVVHGQGQWISEKGRVLQTTAFHVGTPQRMLDGFLSLPQPATFVRRTVIDTIGMLDESLHFVLDKDLFLRAIATFPAVSIDEPIACLRLHERSKSVSAVSRFAPEILRIAEKIVAHPDQYPRFQIHEHKVLSVAHQVAAGFLYMDGRFQDAARNLREAIAHDPSRRTAILGREVPRMLLRRVIGAWPYLELSGRYRSIGKPRKLLKPRE